MITNKKDELDEFLEEQQAEVDSIIAEEVFWHIIMAVVEYFGI